MVSQNCIRHHLFKNESFAITKVGLSDIQVILASSVGLVRGYVCTDDNQAIFKKSSLLLEDFVDENSIGYYEQFGNSGTRDENSIFSKFNFGKTSYVSFGSINVEDLQFIVLGNDFGRTCYNQTHTEDEGKEIAQKITNYIKTLDFDNIKTPMATYHRNYVVLWKMVRQVFFLMTMLLI
jgi:hypothetical protein